MSKMVVLPKTTLYIGWLVCVLVIPVGHENEKGLAPVLLQVQAFCYMQICIFIMFRRSSLWPERPHPHARDGRLRSGPCHPPLRQAGRQAPPPTTAGWWGEQTPPCLVQKQGRGCLFWAYSGGIGQGRDCHYSGGKLVQGQKRVVRGGVIAAAHLWADEGHAVPHIEYIVGNQRVRVLRGADGAA